MNLAQALAQDGGFLQALLRRVAQQLVGGQRDDDAVNRAARPVRAELLEEVFPFGLVGRALFVKGDAAGGVEDDGVVGEPPVVVARAAEAGDLFLAEREIETGMDQAGGLAGAGLADEGDPREAINREVGVFESGELFAEFVAIDLFLLGDIGPAGAFLRERVGQALGALLHAAAADQRDQPEDGQRAEADDDQPHAGFFGAQGGEEEIERGKCAADAGQHEDEPDMGRELDELGDDLIHASDAPGWGGRGAAARQALSP